MRKRLIGNPTAGQFASRMVALGAIAHFDPSWGATDDGTTSAWIDRIGGTVCTSTSQATRLVYSSALSGLNNFPGWTGTYAANTKLVSANSTLSALLGANAAYTLYVVKKAAAPAATAAYFWTGDYTTGHHIYHGVTVTGLANKAISSRNGAGGQVTNTTSVIRPLTEATVSDFVYSGSDYSTYENGGPSALAESNTRSPVLTTGLVAIGGILSSATVAANCFDGLFGDIVIFPTAHTDSERRLVEQLIARKYSWPVIQGLSGFTNANYLANAGLTSGIRGDDANGVWADVLMRPDIVPTTFNYLEAAWLGTTGQALYSNGAGLAAIGLNGVTSAVSPIRTIVANDVGKLMLAGNAAGPANLVRLFVNGAEIGAGTALAGFQKNSSMAFTVGARAVANPASAYSMFGVAGGNAAQVAADSAGRAAAIKAAAAFVTSGGVAAAHGWAFASVAASYSDLVGSDALTLAGTLSAAQIIVPTWPW